jgi:UDP-N-acetylglucosamine:LPS N-acetylglucosamine transferase
MSRRPRVLALSSTGGHWVQLLRLAPAWDGCEVHYATTMAESLEQALSTARARGQPAPRFHLFTDANRWQKLRLLRQAIELTWLLVRVRPDVLITSGAAPGYVAIRLGRLLGTRTVWLDSIANVEELSMTGELAGPYAHLWLTQWPELARPGGPQHLGSVL